MKAILTNGQTPRVVIDEDGIVKYYDPESLFTDEANIIQADEIELIVIDNIDEFDEVFLPIENSLEEDCFHFETYGEEYEMVLAAHAENPNTVWTVVDGEDGKLCVQHGLHFCDRVMYIITVTPAFWPVQDFRYCENDDEDEVA